MNWLKELTSSRWFFDHLAFTMSVRYTGWALVIISSTKLLWVLRMLPEPCILFR